MEINSAVLTLCQGSPSPTGAPPPPPPPPYWRKYRVASDLSCQWFETQQHPCDVTVICRECEGNKYAGSLASHPHKRLVMWIFSWLLAWINYLTISPVAGGSDATMLVWRHCNEHFFQIPWWSYSLYIQDKQEKRCIERPDTPGDNEMNVWNTLPSWTWTQLNWRPNGWQFRALPRE